MLEHGGQIRAASKQYGIPVDQWLDLSTGSNPFCWPAPMVPEEAWHRLPECDQLLEAAAKQYYNCQSLLATAGSQAVIQVLPRLRTASSVGVLETSYNEHAFAWKIAGHQVITINPEQITTATTKLDVLILCNPNNPTGFALPPDEVMRLADIFSKKGGWLVVDEAFIDTRPHMSVASFAGREGLIVLRSFGKYFGLSGARIGFVLAWSTLLSQIQNLLGPWTVNGPACWVARQALLDTAWQKETTTWLQQASNRLLDLLTKHDLAPSGSTDFFHWYCGNDASVVHQALAKQAILTRLFLNPQSIRFGLPGKEEDWLKLSTALAALSLSYRLSLT